MNINIYVKDIHLNVICSGNWCTAQILFLPPPPNFQHQNTNSSVSQLFQVFPAELITEALPRNC